MRKNKHKSDGFTLIELLVVIAIIGLLASVVLLNLNNARVKARDAKRKTDLVQLQKALEIYYNTYQNYPTTPDPTDGECATDTVSGQKYYWYGISDNGRNHPTSGADAYIPHLSPSFVTVLPVDPLRRTDEWSGYQYCSNGTNYKLLANDKGPESFPLASEPFYDPVRPTWAWMVCVGQAACDTW